MAAYNELSWRLAMLSGSSGLPTAFGWTSSGERIAVVFEEMSEDPRLVFQLPLTPCRPSAANEDENDE
jgi:hypothetical protein